MISWKTKRVPLYLGHIEESQMAHRQDSPTVEYGVRDKFVFDAFA